MLLFYSLLIIVAMATFNGTGVTVTKNASAAQRSTIDTSRTVVCWVFFLIKGDEKFIWLELVGFVILVAGTLIYNEILVLPWFGLDQNTKAARARRDLEDKSVDGAEGLINNERMAKRKNLTDGNNTDYIATSPKGYDANRMKRNLER